MYFFDESWIEARINGIAVVMLEIIACRNAGVVRWSNAISCTSLRRLRELG